ncbi:beta-propeller fold lactonase family protein [Streptomyces violaceoruber]
MRRRVYMVSAGVVLALSAAACGTSQEAGAEGADASGGERVYVTNWKSSTISSYRLNPDGSLKDSVESTPAGKDSKNPQGSVRSPDGTWLYVADWGSGSVTGYRIGDDGGLTDPITVAGASPKPVTPSSIAISPNGEHLYTANFSNGAAGTVSHFTTSQSGAPQAVSTVPAHGRGTTGVAVSPDGRTLITTNSESGNVSSFAIQEDGGLTWVMTVDTGRGAFFPAISPKNDYVVVTNAKDNTVSLLRLEESSRLDLVNSVRSQGTEPRGVILNKSGDVGYVAHFNHATNPGSVGVIHVTQDGVETVGKKQDTGSNGTEGIALAHDGKTLYAANFNKNGKGSVTTFPVSPDGTLGDHADPVLTGGRQPDLASITVPRTP